MGACESTENMANHIAQHEKEKAAKAKKAENTDKSTKATKEAKPANGSKEVKPAKSTKGTKAAKATKSTKSTKVANGTKEAKPTKITKPTKTTKATKATKASKPTKVANGTTTGKKQKKLSRSDSIEAQIELQTYKRLVSLGYDENTSRSVSKQFNGNYTRCVSYLTKKAKAEKAAKAAKATKGVKPEKSAKGQEEQKKSGNKLSTDQHREYESKQQHQKQERKSSRSTKKKSKKSDSEQEKLKQTKIDALSRNIEILQAAQQRIDGLKKEIEDLKAVNASQKEEIEEREDTIYKTQGDIKEMSLTIFDLQNQVNQKEQEMNSIQDSLYKVQGDSINKLKYNKQSKKHVVCINKINHLYYCDDNRDGINNKTEQKLIIIRDITTANAVIQKELTKKAWFLVIGEKRSALFIAETQSIRDKWVDFIKRAINKNGTGMLGTNGYNKHNPNRSSISSLTNISTNLLYANQANHANRSSLSSLMPIIHNPHKSIPDDAFRAISLKFNYPAVVRNCTVCNNGHTVQIHINQKQNECILMIHNEIYHLKRFHFHIPSEHTINSTQYEMEMHLVHNKKDEYDDDEDGAEMVVLSYLFTAKQKYIKPKLELNKNKTYYVAATAPNGGDSLVIKPKKAKKIGKIKSNSIDTDDEESDDLETDVELDEDEEIGNEFLAQFWDQLPLKKTKDKIPLNEPINFEYLLETSSNNFTKSVKTNEYKMQLELHEYSGPLRTPPYTEGVQWLISKRTHYINAKQLQKIKKIWYNHL